MHIGRCLAVVSALLVMAGLWLFSGRVGESTPYTLLAAEMAHADGVARPDETARLDWRPLDRRELAGWSGPYWIRWLLALPDQPSEGEVPALGLALRAASEIHWDGRLLARLGTVGDGPGSEQPGPIDSIVALPPDSVGPGRHELLIRASHHRLGFPLHGAEMYFALATADVLYARIYSRWLVVAIAFGALLAAGLYFLIGSRRRRGNARAGESWLIALGLVGMLLPIVEGWRPLFGYSYDLHPYRLFAVLALNAAAAALLPAYLAHRFGRPWPPLAIVGFVLLIGIVVIATPGFDGRNLFLHLTGLLSSLAIVLSVRGAARGDAIPIAALLVTTLVLLLANASAFLDGLYVITLAVLMVFLLLRHAAHLGALGEQNARLRAQRASLSTQLLQRSIHPHWLMNTLTSLQELIERQPAHASRMVDHLAEEFTRLRAIGERPLIPLPEEIALCRAHLEIVGLAHGRALGFEVDDEVATRSIELPPGVLHTLVENGLTHAGATACAAQPFRLHVQQGDGRVLLELSAPLAARVADAIPDGTGTRFVRASLETAWPGRWSFAQGREDDRWLSRMELPCAS